MSSDSSQKFIDITYRDFYRSVVNGYERIFDETAIGFLDAVKDTCSQYVDVLPSELPLYRAQRGYHFPDYPDDHSNPMALCLPKERMIPSWQFVSEGRANHARKPVFYAATTETCAVKEMRPWIGQHISVAMFATNRDLQCLNLVTPGTSDDASEFVGAFPDRRRAKGAGWCSKLAWKQISKAFSEPVTLDDEPKGYLPTQILAELFWSLGYDAIIYPSSVEPIPDDAADDSVPPVNLAIRSLEDVEYLRGWVVTIDRFHVSFNREPIY